MSCRRFCWWLLWGLLVGWSMGQPALRASNPEEPPSPQDYWHQWRGPLATGMAPRGDPPLRWDETTHVRWKVALPGPGGATPVIWQDHVFVVAAVETDKPARPDELASRQAANQGQQTQPPARYYRFVVLALDRQTGSLRWQRTACEALPHEGCHPTNTFASASPVTDGQYLYVSFGSRGLYCYDLQGRLQWQRDLGDMRTRHGWGEGASPALHDDLLLVNWDHEESSFFTALETRTGKTRWTVTRQEPTSWSTPLVIAHGPQAQVVVSATNQIRSYEVQTGTLRWARGGMTTNVIASPVADQQQVICSSWYGTSAVVAIPFDSQGDLTSTDEVAWVSDLIAPYAPSPLLYDNVLYLTLANQPIIAALDVQTGQPRWEPARLPRLTGQLYASPVAAAGRIYVVGRDGSTVVLRHSAEMELLAHNTLDDQFDASPAIVGTQLFLRGQRFLYCLQQEPASRTGP